MSDESGTPGRSPATETLKRLADDLGIAAEALPTAVKKDVLDAWESRLHDLLELRVGDRLIARMTQAEMDEFEKLIDSGDEHAADAWLDEHAPDYRDVVYDEIDQLVGEAAFWFSGELSSQLAGGAR